MSSLEKPQTWNLIAHRFLTNDDPSREKMKRGAVYMRSWCRAACWVRHVWMHSRGLGGKDNFAWIYAGSEVRVNRKCVRVTGWRRLLVWKDNDEGRNEACTFSFSCRGTFVCVVFCHCDALLTNEGHDMGRGGVFFFFDHGEMPSGNTVREGEGGHDELVLGFCWAGIGIDGKGGGDENVMWYK
ncbi:hypothetical protein M431DRAFT_226038 [Trichoderma harzianum CBS 226.95]|uniref:Uncharacterized protein n=1 Tax=Trichoderma harzianum CBS 226.95 TaxID=983964 RepID=A0A2T4A3V2_TRIHA|nr:hypothetical protein M431DRAFT_226038 [Trichoderma harzianum CBS 226.95]PTB51728.1 hypothetical protein M431DRAFT_226038 [Trichoderma harzianum CBS 226.95]